MGIFTIGNLITLVIVAIVLFVYRMMDKDNRSLDKVRRYADKCKDDIAAFVDHKGAEVKDFGIALEVEKKSAIELMRRLQAVNEKELVDKAKTISSLDERLKNYDSSLEGLVTMTGRVQENLNRIRDESGFVENVGKRLVEAKEKVELFEKNLGSLESRFEKENYESLKNLAEEITESVRSAVADLETNAGTIERQVDEHRRVIDKIESSRTANIARDTELINKTLKDAVERAGSRADKMEETALVKLRDQAQERLNLLKNTWEEKLKATQDSVKTKITEIQDQLKANRDHWKNECVDIETRQKSYTDEWKKTVHELDALAMQQRNEWTNISRETEQNIIAASGSRLEEYKAAQAEQFKQLENLANDASLLDTELRLSMQTVISNVNTDFSRFQDESRQNREAVEAEFSSLFGELNGKLDTVEQELAAIKDQARLNVSEKLKLFEDDFASDLDKRSVAIERQLGIWQDDFTSRITDIASEGEEERRQLEIRFNSEQRKIVADHGEKILNELERLKAQAGALDDGIRDTMQAADETCQSFKDQLARDLEDVKSAAETEITSRIGQYNITMSETLRKNQRELDEQLREINTSVEEWNSGMEAAADTSRKKIQDWQNQYSSQMRDMETSLEEIRRRSRDMSAENDERVTLIRNTLEDMRKDLSAQEKLFDQAEQRKRMLEQAIEDLNGEISRVEQRKSEVSQMENQFTSIKRLGEDVNSKMTRFLSEQRRIEIMEGDFKRLLQTSQAVDEKLAQVSNSDDTLQAVQVQIRKLDDSLKDVEDKYQRVEKKNKVIDETTDGINRNFKALQDTEAATHKIGDEIVQIFSELAKIRESIETLAAGSEKAQSAADKVAVLDETLPHLEKRIAEMQVAREWLARTETELLALDKDAQTQLRLIRSLLDRENKKSAAGAGKRAPPVRDRENIIKLRRRGWTVEEIAKTYETSIGEIELILEFEKLEDDPRK